MKYEQCPKLILVGPILSKPLDPQTLKKLQLEGTPQIAVDGGVHFALDPVHWSGDADSSGAFATTSPFIKKKSQDETDLRHALQQIEHWKWNELHLFGFLGKRKDHEWANLGEVCQELTHRSAPTQAIFYDEGMNPHIYLYPAGSHALSIQGLFSVLSFEKNQVTISGACRYEIKDQSLAPLSGRGISNVGSGLVHIQNSALLMVIVVGEES